MNRRKILTIIFVVVVIMLATFSFYFYQMVKSPNFQVGKPAPGAYLYIPKGATFRTVLDSMKANDMVYDITSFAFLSKLMKYQDNIKPGRYLIDSAATNMQIVVKLRAGQQAPVQLQFTPVRTPEELAKRIANQLSFSEEELLKALKSPEIAKKYGFNTDTFMAMFLPNTYEFYWDTSVDKFLDRMHKEYEKFWTPERTAKAKAIPLSPTEVSVLASIVQWETAKNDEKPRVAGVYINRLRKDMLLQADPTVIFALKDFTIRRVLNVHLQVDSPYNTYKYKGLPPGPVFVPALSSLEAVLNYESHNYIYFCAKDDFSGYHNFAESYQKHLQNARLYQRAYNKMMKEKEAKK